MTSVALDTTGGIKITYGNQVNSAVATANILYLTPSVSPNNDVIWNCGYHALAGSLPTGVTQGSTSVLAKYLPQTCRL